MATACATFTCTPFSSSLVNQAPYLSKRGPFLLHYRILSSGSSSSLLLSSSASTSSSSIGLPGVQSLLPRPYLGHYKRSQSRSSLSTFRPPQQQLQNRRHSQRTRIASRVSASSREAPPTDSEEVFFDGGVHYGDLLVNLIFGLTLVWSPLTLAAIFRGLFLRYRFTNLRVTVQSGLVGGDRKDFSYGVVKDVRLVPRFIGEWGDIAIELKDGTAVDIRCVPRFREIAKYIKDRAAAGRNNGSDPSLLSSGSAARGETPKKGFS